MSRTELQISSGFEEVGLINAKVTYVLAKVLMDDGQMINIFKGN